MTMVQGREEVKPLEVKNVVETIPEIEVDDQLNTRLLEYLLPRLESDRANRATRCGRYASVDKMMSTWQKLSPDDSIRLKREETTGVQQGIAATLPIADTHIEDTVAFFTEIYFPSTTIFYSNQGDPAQVEQVTKLGNVLEADTKVEGFYAKGARVIRSLFKYNIGGMVLEWVDKDEDAVGYEQISGNRNQVIDMYNFMWDQTIQDPNLIRKEAEWFAYVEHKNRLHMFRGAQQGDYIRINELMEYRGTSNFEGFASKFYKYPPSEVGLGQEGNDQTSTTQVDWEGYFPTLGEAYLTNIQGFEVVTMYCWLNPKQLQFGDAETLTLFKIKIADSCQVIQFEEMADAKEHPLHLSLFRMDEMGQAMRSYAESMRSFQRHISFMANTAVAVERGNTYNMRIYDPTAIEGTIEAGQTSGWLKSKIPGRDVRSIIANLNEPQDTARHYSAIAQTIQLMKEMFPSQGLPAQVAGIDRAVNSQVAAVMIGAVRRLHMWVKILDATLFGPWRVACYRNHIDHGNSGEFSALTEKDVAMLLSSGLAQLNREVASGAVERILFTLIQNPDSAAQFDMVGLFKFWSMLLNNGIDLSRFVAASGAAGSQGAVAPVDPAAAATGTPTGIPNGGGAPVIQ